ncbi:MAG: hypothetical protein D8M58_19365 [Calditrichaeota bacterium]|nr:MAG: hypothetical protein DWQ03_22045 [Calditrichota bacterium]MBL1207572.1 hypothetical protein [Calditrichota bacterium]NOG47404.1 PorV/PorQ family protein [Calditrichota bacterium]
MKKIIDLLIMLILLSASSSLFAQGAGTSAVPFLMISPGAKAGSMGESGVALATDATAVFWNPAGLAFQYEDPEEDKIFEASLMHVDWLPQFNFSDLFYDYLAARYYVEDIGMIGGSITFLNLGENVYTDDGGFTLGTFDSKEYAFTLSYATKLEENLGVGVNVKLIRSELAPSKILVENETTNGQATAFALDVGVMWKPGYDIFDNRLTAGLNLSNFGPAITYNDDAQADPLPTNLRIGLAYEAFEDEYNSLIVTYETTRMLVRRTGTSADNFVEATFYSSWIKGSAKSRLNSFTHAIGVEYVYGKLFAIRAGYFNEHQSFGNRKFLTAGFGLEIDMIGIDFGYISANEESPLAGTMRYSVSVKF